MNALCGFEISDCGTYASRCWPYNRVRNLCASFWPPFKFDIGGRHRLWILRCTTMIPELRTSGHRLVRVHMSAFDPKRTSQRPLLEHRNRLLPSRVQLITLLAVR